MTRIDKTPTPRAGARRPGRQQAEAAAEKRPSVALVAVSTLFRAETREYFLLLGTTIFLLVFGLVMVLSSSSIESRIGSGDFFARAARQGLYAVVGLPLMLIAARAPIAFWKRWAGVALLAGVALQLLVFTGLGVETGGNQSWLDFGSFSMQPSELIKLALVLWLPWILVKRSVDFDDWRRVLVPAGPVVAVAVGLVLAGRDLGSASTKFLVK